MFKSFVENIRSQRLIHKEDRVLVAVSGGMDSVVLLHLLHLCMSELSISLHVAHLDHAIRDESFRDADFVCKLCGDLGLPCSISRVDVPTQARLRKQGLEEAARQERRTYLEQVALQKGCDVIALGHHRDDQVETFLHRLMRGTGLSGLGAMRPKSGPYIRPLLRFSRSCIESYCLDQGFTYVEDVSNRDQSFTRNRIRHSLVPLLNEFNPAFDEAVDRLCRQLVAEEDYWHSLEDEALVGMLRSEGEGVSLERSALLSLHEALCMRVLRRALEEVRGGLQGVSRVHLEALLRLLRHGPSQGQVDLPGAWAARRYDRLLILPTPPRIPGNYELTVDGPGVWPLPCGGSVAVSIEEAPLGESQCVVEFSAEALPFPVTVRNFRRGDRMRPLGLGGGRKLKDIFIDEKLARELRGVLPLIVKGKDVLWGPGLRCSELCRPKDESDKVIRFEISDCPAVDKWLVRSRGL